VGTVDGPPLPLHTAGSFPTRPIKRCRLVCAVNDRSGKSNKTDDAWLTATEALELLRSSFRCSEGRTEALLREAVASGEVRLQEHTLLLAASGEHTWYVNRITPEAMTARYSRYSGGDSFSDPWVGVRISDADLRAWILAQKPAPPPPSRRYASDDDLVAEAKEGINSGAWPNAHKAAKALAKRAEGNEQAAITRLRGKIRAKIRATLQG
jgi:hypothetical protein